MFNSSDNKNHIYGSADSIDEDSLYIVDQLTETIAECKNMFKKK